MARITLSIVCILFLTTSMKAQEFNRYRFGLQASPMLSWLKPDVEDYKMDGVKMGFNWGGVIEYYFAENYAIKTGFSITNNGGKLYYKDEWVDKGGTPHPVGNLSRNYSLRYLEFPVSVKFKTNEIGYLTYFGFIGLSTSFRTKATSDDRYENLTATETMIWENRDAKKDILFFRSSVMVGMGVEYGITQNTALITSLSFNNGFTNNLRGKNANDKSHRAILNYVDLSIGILF